MKILQVNMRVDHFRRWAIYHPRQLQHYDLFGVILQFSSFQYSPHRTRTNVQAHFVSNCTFPPSTAYVVPTLSSIVSINISFAQHLRLISL